MADYSKIINHPNAQDIVDQLVSGVKPKIISDQLKLKYPAADQAHLRLSSKLLKEFLDNNLDLYATLKSDVQNNKSIDKEISASLKNNKTYQQRMAELATKEVDIKDMLVKLHALLMTRVEQYFDRMQQNPESLKPDYGLIKYFEIMLNYAEKYDKIVNQSPDQIIQHNVTVQVMDQYVSVLQNCIRETLSEMDPEAANLFFEKFNEKSKNLQLPESHQPQLSQEKRMLEAQVLSEIATNANDSISTEDIVFPEV